MLLAFKKNLCFQLSFESCSRSISLPRVVTWKEENMFATKTQPVPAQLTGYAILQRVWVGISYNQSQQRAICSSQTATD